MQKKINIQDKKARFEYEILDKYVAGIQLTGTQFTNTNALFGNDISTFPNYPAEIRAPQGTLAGVSGFQLKFGSVKIYF